MPTIPDKFQDEASINPPELKPYYIKQTDGSYLLDADAVTTGGRLNTALERTKNDIQADRDRQREAKNQAQSQIVQQNQQIQTLTEQLATGARVSQDDVKLLEKIKPLNLQVDEIEKRLKDFPALSQQIQASEQSSVFGLAAKTLGFNEQRLATMWQNPVFSKDKELIREKVTVKQLDQNGAERLVEIERPMFKIKKADGTTEKIDAAVYVQQDPQWRDITPYLIEQQQPQQNPYEMPQQFNGYNPQNPQQQNQFGQFNGFNPFDPNGAAQQFGQNQFGQNTNPFAPNAGAQQQSAYNPVQPPYNQNQPQQQGQGLGWLPQASAGAQQTNQNQNQPDVVGNFLTALNAPSQGQSSNPFAQPQQQPNANNNQSNNK